MTFNSFISAPFLSPAFITGMVLSLSLIVAIGPQNAHIMRMGLLRQHLWLTVAVCVGTDILLIGIGVSGLAALGGLPKFVVTAMTAAGALVLCAYGWRAMRRFLQPGTAGEGAAVGTEMPVSRRQAVGTALAMSWLNPHAWLDTAVLIGTASLAYARPDNAVFGLGAAAGSLVWFMVLGGAMALLGRRMRSPALWRALDALVALTMWGCAGWLLSGLL
jgi:L-lysine exporter family protein LysE/ArgO